MANAFTPLTMDECDEAYAEGLGNFFMGLSATLLSSRFVHFFLKHIGQPRVLSEIIVGMVIRNTDLIKLVDPSLPRLIRIVCEYGIMSYFFVLGLEMEVKNIFRRRRPTREAVMAYCGIAATYVLLACLQPVIVKGLAPGDRAKYIISLGLTLSNTSSTVLTRLITDLKIGKSEIGWLVVNAGVHNDMITMLLMALFFVFHAQIIGRKMDFIFTRTFFIVLLLVFQTWFIRKVGRRGIDWINDKNPEGKPISGWHVFVSMIVVAILCAIANMMGYNGTINAFLIGLTLPREGRVSRAFIRKINIWLAEMIFPLYYTFVGTLLGFDSWKGWTTFKEFSVLVLLGMVGKVAGSVPAAISMGFSIPEAVCVGLLLNVKGHYHILAVINAFEIGVLNSTGLLINVMAVLVTILYIPLVAEIIVWQARKRHAKLQMGLQWHNPDSELRIMTCLHSPQDVPSAIKMIEVTRGRPPSPGLTVFAADLVQLSSRTAATLTHGQGMDVVDVKDEAIVDMREEITMAFNNYLDGCGEGVDISRLLIVSAYNTMHLDICNAAQDALAVLIILPFHKKQRVDGAMDDGHNELRTVNRKVLRHAPCSVGILVDRGLGGSSMMASSLESFQVVVVFIGGPDDREALSYASRVAYYPGVKLTAIRFLLESEHDNISIASSRYGSKNASERRLIMNSQEGMHVDDEYFANFYELYVTNGPVSYVEKHVSNGAETIAALRALESQYKLFIIGNGSSHLSRGKAEWEECPELGPLGDNLASSDFSATASLLIIRQHNPKRQEEEDLIEEEFSLR